jgi:hypothetical protein
MMRPHEAAQIPVDLDAVATFAATVLGVDEAEMRNAIRDLAASPPDSPDIARFAQALPRPLRWVFETFRGADASDLPKFPQLDGLIDDGRGNSQLLKAASDQQLLSARIDTQLLRTGRLERAVRAATATAPLDQREVLLFLADWARMYRFLPRGNPALAAYLLCVQVHADGLPIPIPTQSKLDVSALLKTLREQSMPNC